MTLSPNNIPNMFFPVDDDTKRALANCVRKHYQAHPEAIDMQASGNTKPPTVDNHLKSVA